MRLYLSILLAGLALTLTIPAVPVYGHHGAGSFWFTDRQVEIEGTVLWVKIVNPHPELAIEVTEGGQKSVWRISGGGNASGMIRAGWKNDTLPAGMKVKVQGNPSRTEGAKALLAGKVTKPDGSVLNFSAGSPPIQTQ